MTAANGDPVEFQGSAATGLYTITGGTGRFLGATGAFAVVMQGQINPEGTTTINVKRFGLTRISTGAVADLAPGDARMRGLHCCSVHERVPVASLSVNYGRSRWRCSWRQEY